VPVGVRVVDRIRDQSDFQGPPADGGLLRYDASVGKFVQVVWTRELPSGTVNGTNPTFTLSATPKPASSLLLHVNGILQRSGVGNDYTLSGVTVSFLTGSVPAAGDSLEAVYLR
jgi:hypothetical protein